MPFKRHLVYIPYETFCEKRRRLLSALPLSCLSPEVEGKSKVKMRWSGMEFAIHCVTANCPEP